MMIKREQSHTNICKLVDELLYWGQAKKAREIVELSDENKLRLHDTLAWDSLEKKLGEKTEEELDAIEVRLLEENKQLAEAWNLY
jgi:hypothetical protein